jgi:hypothetical protein
MRSTHVVAHDTSPPTNTFVAAQHRHVVLGLRDTFHLQL